MKLYLFNDAWSVICIGAVELEKLTLKKDAFRKLRLPIEIKAGEYITVTIIIVLLPSINYYCLVPQDILGN